MQVTYHFILEMLMLYLIGLLGFVVRKKEILSKHANDVLTQVILYITLPALIMYSLDISFSMSLIYDFIWLIGLSIYIITLSIVLASWMRKRLQMKSDQAKVYESLIIFGNQGFIGYAVSYIIMQETGVIYLTIFNIYYLIMIWTYGIYLFTKSKQTIDWKRIFFNPGIISTVIGLIILCTPLRWPSLIGQTLNSVGQMTIPLSMLVIGSLIASISTKEIAFYIKSRSLWKMTVTRLIIIPLFITPFFFFPIPYSVLLIACLISGMPAAPTVVLYAKRFGGDVSYGSIGVLLTTLICVISTPLLYLGLQMFFK